MNLLLGRSQKDAVFSLIPLRIGRGVMFMLHAELELDQEEKDLIRKFRFASAVLVSRDPIEDLKRAVRPALLLGLVVLIVGWFTISFVLAINLAILTVLIMTGVYFKVMREQIAVSDLMHGGRRFRCDSIVELIEKEAYLKLITQYLRQVLESAKRWDTREIVGIEPLEPEKAKEAVLKRLHA